MQDIIRECIKGKASAQRALVHKCSGFLYTVSLRYMKNEASAQDILQDSFIKIFKAIESYDPNRGSFEGWMRKIVINTALKQLDRNKLKTTGLSIENYSLPSYEHSIVDKMSADDLLKVVRTLPDGYLQVFNLSVIEGYSHKEIGEMLGIVESSSRSNLSRAKQLLRKKLSSLKNQEPWVKIS